MSALLCVLHKTGGSHFRSVTTQATAVITSNSNSIWQKHEESCKHAKLNQRELQKLYDDQYQKILSLNSSLHELYKIDPRLVNIIWLSWQQNYFKLSWIENILCLEWELFQAWWQEWRRFFVQTQLKIRMAMSSFMIPLLINFFCSVNNNFNRNIFLQHLIGAGALLFLSTLQCLKVANIFLKFRAQIFLAHLDNFKMNF